MTDCPHQYRRDIETCLFCDLNEAEEALRICRLERDEARTAAISLLMYLKETCSDVRDAAAEIEATWQHLDRTVDRFYPWLREKQPTVDEKGEETVS